LKYEWTQIDGPKVELSDPTAAKPYFRTGKPGLYRFQLVVTANGLRSEPFIVELMIEREKHPPIAKAPAEIHGEVGKLLEIDGRDSYDPEGGSLTYRWRPLTRGLDIPPAALNQPVLSFEPQQDGVFEVELMVSDGETASRPAFTRLIIKPKPRPPVARGRAVPREIPTAPPPEQAMAPPAGAKPIAHIEGAAVVPLGPPIMLDGRGSRGSTGSRLEYLWRQKEGAFISDFELVFDGAAKRFRPPRSGDYEFELVVADGIRESDPVYHKIRVTREEEPPVAVVVAPTRAMPGALVKMDATQSYDLQGSPLVYRWRQTGGPKVTSYVIDEKTGDAAPAFHPPVAGAYSFELVVSNGRLQSRPIEIDIEVGNPQRTPSLVILGPEVARVGDSLALSVELRDYRAGSLTFIWRQVDGPSPVLPQTNGPRITMAPPVSGRYVIDVSALDKGKIVATARRNLEVFAVPDKVAASDMNQEPPLYASPASSLPHLAPLRPLPTAPANPASAPSVPEFHSVGRPAAQIHPFAIGGGTFNLDDSNPLAPLQPLP
ncbi:MAG: hypothetical protein FWG74_08070, partial [Planctomycetes bacterium]|nr:hypothetical protein [Planctomycetota bacterium]